MGSCLTLGKELSEETHVDKARDFIGKGQMGGEQEAEETQENCSAAWLADLGFMVMGLVSGWSLANHSNSESPGGAHIAQPRWMLARGILRNGRTRVSPFDLSRTLPVGDGLLIPCSLSGSPVIKQLIQMVTMVPGQGGRFQSVCFP